MEIPNETLNYREATEEELTQLTQYLKISIKTLSAQIEDPLLPMTTKISLKITELVYTLRPLKKSHLMKIWNECMTMQLAER